MSVEFSVPLSQIAEALNLTEVYVAENYKETNISTVEINRPGLELTGYLEFFDNKRIQVLGNTEFSYLGRYGPEAQKMVIDSIFSFGPPAVIICRDIEPSNAILESAKLHKVSIFSTPQSTSDLTASLVQYLNKELAPRIRRTAQTTLYGQSPENIRHFIELRGIGIINARKLFGMGAIKLQEKIDMVINLEQWDSSKVYDRMGLDNEYMKILGVEVPTLTIPVKPGRNLAVIIEVAAMNNRQKKMGYNAARELLKNLGMAVEDLPPSPKVIVDTWE